MESLLIWLVKHLITRDSIKAAIFAANKKLAETKIDDRKAKVAGWGEDVSSTLATYLKAFADDGQISKEELEDINHNVGEMVDKYIPNDVVFEKIIESVLA